MHIVFENLSNINRDMLQKAWGLNIGEDGTPSTITIAMTTELLTITITKKS